MKTTFLILLFLIVMSGCDEVNDPGASVASYTVTFSFHWDSDNFPNDYPSGAHFSPLIGWSHQSSSDFFQPGTTASDGIKQMAETGSTSILRSELEAMINDNQGRQTVTGSGLGNGTGEISIEIEVDQKNSSVTLATMIAPSPDWYVAVVNINLVENGEWIESRVVDGMAFDAGTDGGSTYTSSNMALNPRLPIMQIMDEPLGDGNSVSPAIATVIFERK